MFQRFVSCAAALFVVVVAFVVPGCDEQEMSAPTGNQFEEFANSNPGVLVPASETGSDEFGEGEEG